MEDQKKEIAFTIVTPEKVLAQGSTHMLLLPAVSGQMGVMYMHENMVVTIGKGAIKSLDTQSKVKGEYNLERGGIARIDGQSCTILCD